jgi:hypothetical protein
MPTYVERSLVILLLDPAGPGSAIAMAARRLGHRVVTATGIETALVVLGSLVPDVVVVVAQSPERDRETLKRIIGTTHEVSVRVVDAPDRLAAALLESPHLLN